MYYYVDRQLTTGLSTLVDGMLLWSMVFDKKKHMFEQLTPNSGTSSGHSPDGSGEGGHANSAKI